MNIERCTETIDLEDCIAMSEKKKKRYKVTAIYESGRAESFAGKLKTDGTMDKKGANRVERLREVPTVKNISIERF